MQALWVLRGFLWTLLALAPPLLGTFHHCPPALLPHWTRFISDRTDDSGYLCRASCHYHLLRSFTHPPRSTPLHYSCFGTFPSCFTPLYALVFHGVLLATRDWIIGELAHGRLYYEQLWMSGLTVLWIP